MYMQNMFMKILKTPALAPAQKAAPTRTHLCYIYIFFYIKCVLSFLRFLIFVFANVFYAYYVNLYAYKYVACDILHPKSKLNMIGNFNAS